MSENTTTGSVAGGDAVVASLIDPGWLARHDRQVAEPNRTRATYLEAALRRLEHDLREEYPRDLILADVRAVLREIPEQTSNGSGLYCACEFYSGEHAGLCDECGKPVSSRSSSTEGDPK